MISFTNLDIDPENIFTSPEQTGVIPLHWCHVPVELSVEHSRGSMKKLRIWLNQNSQGGWNHTICSEHRGYGSQKSGITRIDVWFESEEDACLFAISDPLMIIEKE